MKKLIFVLIAVLSLSCSKDDVEKTPDISIIEHGWINGHEEPKPGEENVVGFEWEKYAIIKNNTNKNIKGRFVFYIETHGSEEFGTSIPDSPDEYIVFPPNETKRISEKIWQIGKGLYVVGYDYVKFIQKN